MLERHWNRTRSGNKAFGLRLSSHQWCKFEVPWITEGFRFHQTIISTQKSYTNIYICIWCVYIYMREREPCNGCEYYIIPCWQRRKLSAVCCVEVAVIRKIIQDHSRVYKLMISKVHDSLSRDSGGAPVACFAFHWCWLVSSFVTPLFSIKLWAKAKWTLSTWPAELGRKQSLCCKFKRRPMVCCMIITDNQNELIKSCNEKEP